MPTTKTLQFSGNLPEGGAAKAYLNPEWTQQQNPALPATAASSQSTVAIGAVVDTQTITAGAVTFAGLTDKRDYLAGLDLGSGVWKYVRFDSR